MAKLKEDYLAFGLKCGDLVKVIRMDLFIAVIELPQRAVCKCICVPANCLEMLEN